jgi:hypothetical protein
MPDATDRRFTIVDAMILVASTAVGLALMRDYFPDVLTGRWKVASKESGLGIVVSYIQHALFASLPCGTVGTIAVLILRLRRPRPRLRRLARQPGMVAGLATTVVLCKHMIDGLVRFTLGFLTDVPSPVRLPNPPFMYNRSLTAMPLPLPSFGQEVIRHPILNDSPYSVGIAIGVAWVVLALSGRFRPERSWIDRLGRAIGVYWIGVTLLRAWLSTLSQCVV